VTPGRDRSLARLKDLMEALGELQTARECYERALKIFERFLGENHSRTMRVRGFLERLLQKM